MIATFRYLILTEAKNRLVRQLRRLRRPRYAIAVLIGIAYFWFVFGGAYILGPADEPPPFGRGAISLLRGAGALLVALYAAVTWIFGKNDAIAYRPAEVHLLFPAPLTRRDLLRYKLLHAQIPLAFSAVFMTLLSFGTALPWWLRLPSIWVLLATIQLHHLAAALVHESARQQGLDGWRRNWMPILLFGTAAVIVLGSLSSGIRAARAAPDFGAAATALATALNGDLPRLVLAPFRIVLAPLTATVGAWPQAMALALLVLLAHYVWVLRSDTAFEEAAAEAGDRHERALSALRSGGGWRSYARALDNARSPRRPSKRIPAAFHLALHGRPEVAIFWKNLTFARRNFTSMTPLVLVATVAAMVLLFGTESTLSEALHEVGIMALIFGAIMVVLGPIVARNDLRMDLRSIDLLHTMPLSAPSLVAAEIAASVTTALIAQLTLLGTGALLLILSGDMFVTPLQFGQLAIGTLLVLPAITAIGVTVQCALALTFPAWVHLGAEGPGGVEAMGQNIITMIGSLLLLALFLLLPVVVGGAIGFLVNMVLPSLAFVVGGLAGILVTWGVVALAFQALGRLFERTDPVDVGLAR